MDDSTLTQDLFDKLLIQLGPTEESASQEYERIRDRLIRYFEWQRFINAEDLADEVMDRVAKALGNGKEIRAKDPVGFFYDFARTVANEESRKIPEVSLELPGDQDRHFCRSYEPDESEECQDKYFSYLEKSVRKLPDYQRSLIMGYYFGEESVKTRKRRELAHELGISLKALRIRAHRIRTHLAASVARCADRKSV